MPAGSEIGYNQKAVIANLVALLAASRQSDGQLNEAGARR